MFYILFEKVNEFSIYYCAKIDFFDLFFSILSASKIFFQKKYRKSGRLRHFYKPSGFWKPVGFWEKKEKKEEKKEKNKKEKEQKVKR